MGYTIGYNMPGYLPEMEPYSVDTAEDAREALRDEFARLECVGDSAEEVDNAIAELNSADLSEFATGWYKPLGNGYVYWIEPNSNRVASDGTTVEPCEPPTGMLGYVTAAQPFYVSKWVYDSPSPLYRVTAAYSEARQVSIETPEGFERIPVARICEHFRAIEND